MQTYINQNNPGRKNKAAGKTDDAEIKKFKTTYQISLVGELIDELRKTPEEKTDVRISLAENLHDSKRQLERLTGKKAIKEWLVSVIQKNLNISEAPDDNTVITITPSDKLDLGDTVYVYVDYGEEGYIKYKTIVLYNGKEKTELLVSEDLGERINYGIMRMYGMKENMARPVLIRKSFREYLMGHSL